MARNGLAHDEPYLWNDRYMVYNGKFVHRKIWEKHYGTIPKGMLVHHVNENKQDNRIENLELLTRAAHCKLHRPRLGYRAPVNEICKICGSLRNEKEKKSEPHRKKCNKCRGKDNKKRLERKNEPTL